MNIMNIEYERGDVVNSLKMVVMGLMATTVAVNAMNESVENPKESKKIAIERYQVQLAQQIKNLTSLAAMSDEELFSEALTPRECDNETYGRFADAVSTNDQNEFFNILGQMAVGQAVLSEGSLAKLVELANIQGKQHFADIFTDGQKVLNGAYK